MLPSMPLLGPVQLQRAQALPLQLVVVGAERALLQRAMTALQLVVVGAGRALLQRALLALAPLQLAVAALPLPV